MLAEVPMWQRLRCLFGRHDWVGDSWMSRRRFCLYCTRREVREQLESAWRRAA
jgi:hypothetical protein